MNWPNTHGAKGEQYELDLSVSQACVQGALEVVLTQWRTAPPCIELGNSGRGRRVVTHIWRTAREVLQPSGREMILRVDRGRPGRGDLALAVCVSGDSTWRFDCRSCAAGHHATVEGPTVA